MTCRPFNTVSVARSLMGNRARISSGVGTGLNG